MVGSGDFRIRARGRGGPLDMVVRSGIPAGRVVQSSRPGKRDELPAAMDGRVVCPAARQPLAV